ncbi:MAG: putative signaling protein [Actinomycetia bacterium]|nr:putative signaling protein [Actinomycetes bacterium]
MVDELRRAAIALLEDPPRPPGGLEDLAHRNARRHRRRRALSGAVAGVLALAGLTVVADGKAGDDAHVVTVPKPADGGVLALPAAEGALLVPAIGAPPARVDLGGAPARLEWSADGAWLAGTVRDQLVVFGRDGSGLRRVDLPGVTGFRWSPVAPILAVQAGDGLYTVTPNGHPHRIGDVVADVVWSADGRRLAGQDRDLAGGGIVAMDADGTNRRSVGRYADLPHAAGGLQLRGWANDGRTLLYRAHDQALGEAPDPGQPLVALDLEDGTTFELGSVLGRAQWVQPSPDGRSVVLVVGSGFAYDQGKVLRRCDLVARRCTDLTPSGRFAIDPRWSPDGSRIAYVSAPEGALLDDARPWVVGADGADDHEVAGGAAGAREPGWTADGSAIVHLLAPALEDDPPRLVVDRVAVDGGPARRVATEPIDDAALFLAPGRTEARAAWSPGVAASDP